MSTIGFLLPVLAYAFVFYVACRFKCVSCKKAYRDFWFYSLLTIVMSICIHGITISLCRKDAGVFIVCVFISALFLLAILIRQLICWWITKKYQNEDSNILKDLNNSADE